MGDLTKNFSRSEFVCNPKKCGCGFDGVTKKLAETLQSIRDYIKTPVIIESGCRCRKHNAAVGGVPDSAHLTGEAADIYTSRHTSAGLIQIIKNMYDKGLLPDLRYCYCPGKKTVHVGVDRKKRVSVFKMPG